MHDRMRTYSQAELTKLHDAAMDLLQNTGVLFDDDEAIAIFKEAGCKVEGATVFLAEKNVTQALESAPPHFKLTARNPENSITIGGNGFGLAPGYGAPFMITAEGKHRNTTLADYHDFCKLVQTSGTLNVNGFLMATPSDVPPETSHLDMLYANIVLCDKPFMGSPVSRTGIKDCIHMAEMLWGGPENLKDVTVLLSLITPLSPFQYTSEMATSIIELARNNQGCVFGDLIMAGSSGPLSLGGLLAQQTAETLAGVVLTQFAHPGAPVIVGGTSGITDMRTGELAMGAPEVVRITAATLQIAQFYNLPVRSGYAVTHAHLPDAQAGFESALGLYTALRNGSNFILHAAGILGSYTAMSFEKFIIDEELCGIILETLKPIEITDESIDLDLIKEVGIGGNYLTHPKTYEKCRSAFYNSSLVNRHGYAAWQEDGEKPIHAKATEVLSERLNAYTQPDIDPQIEKDFAAYVAQRKNSS